MSHPFRALESIRGYDDVSEHDREVLHEFAGDLHQRHDELEATRRASAAEDAKRRWLDGEALP